MLHLNKIRSIQEERVSTRDKKSSAIIIMINDGQTRITLYLLSLDASNVKEDLHKLIFASSFVLDPLLTSNIRIKFWTKTIIISAVVTV